MAETIPGIPEGYALSARLVNEGCDDERCEIVGEPASGIGPVETYATIQAEQYGSPAGTDAALAALFGAAPELLGALKGLHEAMGELLVLPDKKRPDSVWAAARKAQSAAFEAITKAEGRGDNEGDGVIPCCDRCGNLLDPPEPCTNPDCNDDDDDDDDDGDDFLGDPQGLINSGLAWRLEGSVGRECMRLIDAGVCMLGEVGHRDFWGNYVPSRYEVKPGTKGSAEYCAARQAEL